jgi:TM2 domain-containing membrane protein YozV
MSQPPMIPPGQSPMVPPNGGSMPPSNMPYPQPYGAPMPPAVAAKNPGLALVASFFIPGLGSLMNGSVGIGIVIFLSYCVAWASIFVVIGFVLVPAVWVWGMVDGYQGAKKWNARHGILS